MPTVTRGEHAVRTGKRSLVEVNWDPVTRIVGSLGI